MVLRIHDDLTDAVADEARVEPLRILHGDREVLALEHVEQRADDAGLLDDLGGFLLGGEHVPQVETASVTLAEREAQLDRLERRQDEIEASARNRPSVGLAESRAPETAALAREPGPASPYQPPWRYSCGYGCGTDAANAKCPTHGDASESVDDGPHDGGTPQVSGQEPVDESAGEAPDVARGDGVDLAVTTDASAPGEDRARPAELRTGDPGRASEWYADAAPNGSVHPATTFPPTDAEIRSWAQAHELPVSVTGAIKRWVREGFVRVDGGEPDAEAWASASREAPKASHRGALVVPPEKRDVPVVPPGEATDAVKRLWCQRNGVRHNVAGDLDAEPAEAYAAAWRRGRPEPVVAAPVPPPVPEQAVEHAIPARTETIAAVPHQRPAPAVEPAGDGTRPRAEQVEMAEELLEQQYTAAHVARETGLTVAQVREIDRDRKGPR